MLASFGIPSWTKVLQTTSLALTLIFAATSDTFAAQPTFEGYYKYSDGTGAHIGYAIIRNEFDDKKSHHIVRSYLRIQAGETQIQESRVITSDSKLAPLSLEYRLITPQGSRAIDAKFSKGKMIGKVTAGGADQTLEKPIPNGAFFTGSLLSWLMGIGGENSKEPRGLAVGRNYQFSAIDEETGDVHHGKVTIPQETQMLGTPTYKVLFEYLGDTHVSYIDKRGEVVKIEVPASGINAVLVANPAEATGNFSVPNAIIEQVTF
jgi:hypothetical protein